MAGLLDIFNTAEGQQYLGLLAAAGPRADGAGFGQRLQEGLAAGDAWKMRQAKMAQEAQQAKYQEMVMQEHQQKQLMERAAMEQAARKREALPGLWTGGSQALAPLAGDPSTGILPSAGRAAVPGSFDVQKALQAGYSPDEIAKLDALRNIGMNEVARTVDVEGANGGKTVRGLDKFGRQVFDQNGYVAPASVNQGDRTTFVKPSAGLSLPMGMSPSDRDASARGWAGNAATLRGQDMTDARARDLNEIKRDEKKKVEDLTKGGQIASFDTMLGTLDRLGQHPGLSRSVGLMGALPTMPGSESANFKAELETFQSQAFIPMVSQLKGMGALSDAEGKKLTAAVGALNPNMGEKAFRASVGRITEEMAAARERVSGAPKPKASQLDALPTANASNRGKKIRDTTTGEVLISNGMSWVKE